MQTISLDRAVAMIPDGASLMIGGFMGVGTPERIMDELVRQGKRNLTVIANDNGLPGVGVGKLVSAVQHTAKGKPKLLKQCTLPLTSVRPVDLVVTEMAVIEFADGVGTLVETAPGVTVQQVLDATEAALRVPDNVPQMRLDGPR